MDNIEWSNDVYIEFGELIGTKVNFTPNQYAPVALGKQSMQIVPAREQLQICDCL